jgi:hypothetical protein
VSFQENPKLSVDNVRVCKLLGGNVGDSHVVRGMVVQRNSEGSIKCVDNAKVCKKIFITRLALQKMFRAGMFGSCKMKVCGRNISGTCFEMNGLIRV